MAHLNKILPTSPSRQHPSELETSIASAIYDLETNTPDMRSALRPLQFVQAKEVSSVPTKFSEEWPQGRAWTDASKLEVGHGKKAIVIYVPVPLLAGFHKVQQRYAIPFATSAQPSSPTS